MNEWPSSSVSSRLKVQRGVLTFTESSALINPTNNSQLCSDNACTHTHTQKLGRKGKWWWRNPISYFLCQQPKSSKKHSPKGPMCHLLFCAPRKALWSEAPSSYMKYPWSSCTCSKGSILQGPSNISAASESLPDMFHSVVPGMKTGAHQGACIYKLV